MIYQEEPYKIKKINDKLITLDQKVTNYNIDFNSEATVGKDKVGKKIHTYESEWIELTNSFDYPYPLSFEVYWEGTSLFLPQAASTKEFSMRMYSTSIQIPNTPNDGIWFYKTIFKTATEYQNQLKYRPGYYDVQLSWPDEIPYAIPEYYRTVNPAGSRFFPSVHSATSVYMSVWHQAAGILQEYLYRDGWGILKSVNIYGPPVISVQGKVIVSVYNPR